MQNLISKEQLVADLKKAGIVSGDILHLKISMKSIGKVDGGAKTVIEALLEAVGPSGTIVSDAFLNIYKKGKKAKASFEENSKSSYAGWFVNEMVKHPDAKRSTHPIQKFVAIGAKAEELTSNHTPASGAYDLLKDMVLLNAKNVKIGDIIKVPGVGTTHIVLCELDFKQRRDSVGVYYRNEKDEVVFYERNWVGGCARGFKNLIPHYGDSVLSQSKVGEAETMVTDMRATYDIEKELIGKEPQIFLCENEDCIDCRLSWSFSDMSLLHFVWRNTLSFKLRSVLNALKLYLFGRVIAGYQIVK